MPPASEIGTPERAQVFARGHSTLGQNPFIKASRVQCTLVVPPMQPTDFPAVAIHPDSVILADQDGAVSFDPADLEAVIELCIKANAVDAKCMADLRNGRSIKDTFKEHRGK